MYRTVLLAYDGTREGRLALREGALLAKICGARVVLLAVVEPRVEYGMVMDGGVGYVPPVESDNFQKILDEGLSRLTRMGLTPEARLEKGPPADRIAAVAQEISADLVVVGHHKQGMIARWLLGSVTSALSDSLNCSLLVASQDIADEALFANSAASPVSK